MCDDKINLCESVGGAEKEEYFCLTPAESDRVDVISMIRKKCSRPDILDAMLDDDVYTQKGRINHSALSRKLKITSANLDTILQEFRGIATKLLE
jgi:hypothetical protein